MGVPSCAALLMDFWSGRLPGGRQIPDVGEEGGFRREFSFQNRSFTEFPGQFLENVLLPFTVASLATCGVEPGSPMSIAEGAN